MHAAAQAYTNSDRPTWRNHIAEVFENLPAHEHEAHEAIAKLCIHLDALPVTVETFGLIHFDFELDNLIWTEHGLTAIDFDDSAWYWFAADIAFALRDLVDDDVAKIDSIAKIDSSSEQFRAFLAGYRTAKSLTDGEIALLPMFLRLHHLISFAKLLRALEREPPIDEPAWAAALRQKLEKEVRDYRTEFIAYIQ